MNTPTREQISEILSAKLESDYPEECVELGENWELIAEIFYKAGMGYELERATMEAERNAAVDVQDWKSD